MKDIYQQIKAQIPLEDVVSETVALKPVGRDRLKGKCPFHNEKTPSFVVMVEQGRYYCYGSGCQAKGDVFDFVENTQKLSAAEARELLAQRAGVTLPERRERTQNKDLYDLQELAQNYFLEGLKGSTEARAYLTGRRFTQETIERWGLGYAPPGWQNLITLARGQGITSEALKRAGLAKKKKNNQGRFYDAFRDRVTIPIKDAFGRIVGFTARTLGDEQPKYLNTSDTDIFKKGDLLFGLHEAKTTLRTSRAAILVEGQLDVIALHQNGFTAAVGAQSATLTPAQIALLDRLGVNTLYPSFDFDDAGQRATLKALDAVARMFLCKVVMLPGKDPADTVMEDPVLFRVALRQAVSETHFRLTEVLRGLDLTSPTDKQEALERLKPRLSDMRVPFDPVADDLRRLVAKHLELDLDVVKGWVKDNSKKLPTVRSSVLRPHSDKVHNARLQLTALVLRDAELMPQLLSKLEAVVPSDDLLDNFCTACRASPETSTRHSNPSPMPTAPRFMPFWRRTSTM